MNRNPVRTPHRHVPLDSAKPLTPRQELYAQNLASGMSQAAAYRAAGYKGSQATQRMKRYPNLQARVAQLMRETAERSRLTIDEITGELLDIVARAKSSGDSAQMLQTARAALMNLAKLHGLEDEPRGPVCTCGGLNGVTKIRWVIVHPDGREEDVEGM